VVDETGDLEKGPVAPITTFTTEEEGIAAANDTEYGLAAYVFTRDIERAMRVCGSIEAGMVGLNLGIISNPAAPFGRMKASGPAGRAVSRASTDSRAAVRRHRCFLTAATAEGTRRIERRCALDEQQVDPGAEPVRCTALVHRRWLSERSSTLVCWCSSAAIPDAAARNEVCGQYRLQGRADGFGFGGDDEACTDCGDAAGVDVLVLGEEGDDDKRDAGGESAENRATTAMADHRCGAPEDRGLVDPTCDPHMRRRACRACPGPRRVPR
jgi:hypothetical protein